MGRAGRGGASGATCIKRVLLNAGDVITGTVGQGGLSAPRQLLLNPGTDTTVTAPGVNLVAEAGKALNDVAKATGGDVNLRGGASEYTTNHTTTSDVNARILYPARGASSFWGPGSVDGDRGNDINYVGAYGSGGGGGQYAGGIDNGRSSARGADGVVIIIKL